MALNQEQRYKLFSDILNYYRGLSGDKAAEHKEGYITVLKSIYLVNAHHHEERNQALRSEIVTALGDEEAQGFFNIVSALPTPLFNGAGNTNTALTEDGPAARLILQAIQDGAIELAQEELNELGIQRAAVHATTEALPGPQEYALNAAVQVLLARVPEEANNDGDNAHHAQPAESHPEFVVGMTASMAILLMHDSD